MPLRQSELLVYMKLTTEPTTWTCLPPYFVADRGIEYPGLVEFDKASGTRQSYSAAGGKKRARVTLTFRRLPVASWYWFETTWIAACKGSPSTAPVTVDVKYRQNGADVIVSGLTITGARFFPSSEVLHKMRVIGKSGVVELIQATAS